MLVHSHRLFLACLLVVLATTSLIAAERPNIVWLISEDNSTHYLKMYDRHGVETPRIAELASGGLQFMHAFSNAPVCSVARTTLMTGCYGPRIGTQFHRRSVSVPMPAGLKMFPAYLRDAGYYTANNQKKDYNADETPGTWDKSGAEASWRGRPSDKPFFYMQSFASTHESSLHFTQEQYRAEKTITNPESVFVAPYHPQTELFRYTVAKYHDNIRRMDQQIGAVVDQLSSDGLLDDTFIFYFGDHGGVLPRGKGYAYESGLHVPLVVRVPKNFQHLSDFPSGSQVQGFVQFVDLGATALKLAGVDVPKQVDGRAFLGQDVTAAQVNARDEAFGYADRFDEKYDMVRTLRKGKYEYVRSYQPFNFDGLHNNYRYIMLAYREWRELFEAGKLNESQSQFYRSRPAEMLFDVEADPYEVKDLARDPQYANVLESLRGAMQKRVKSMPDLSFYPESYLVEHAFGNPVQFGQQHKTSIAKLIDIADLSLDSFEQAEAGIQAALESGDEMQRYWGLIVCSSFGKQASKFAASARKLASAGNPTLVRTRAAEFLGLIGADDPRPIIMDCLKQSTSGIETGLILNSVVLLQDGDAQVEFTVRSEHIQPQHLSNDTVKRRLEYLDPQGSPATKSNRAKKKKRIK